MNLTHALCYELGTPPIWDLGATIFVVDDDDSESLEIMMRKMKADFHADLVRMGARLRLAPPVISAPVDCIQGRNGV